MWKAQNVDVFLMFNAGKISDARVLSRFNNPFLVYSNKVLFYLASVFGKLLCDLELQSKPSVKTKML